MTTQAQTKPDGRERRETHAEALRSQLRDKLVIRRALYDEMPIAADIIRSTASWYRPLLDEHDMREHDVPPEWIARNYYVRRFHLAFRGNKPVGVLSTQEAGDHLYVGYCYLYEDEVGKGYGRQLLEHARRQAIERGKAGLVLISHPSARWAIRAYERFGFQRVARTRDEVLAWNGGFLEPYYEQGFELFELRTDDQQECASETDKPLPMVAQA